MAYTLQALIADREVLSGAGLKVGARSFVPLPQAKAMLPLTDALLEHLRIPFLPLTDEGADSLPAELDLLGRAASAKGLVAYVEAEFFGGAGTQASVLWQHGNRVAGPVVCAQAINQALVALGVKRDAASDEFDALNLARHRATDDWSCETGV